MQGLGGRSEQLAAWGRGWPGLTVTLGASSHNFNFNPPPPRVCAQMRTAEDEYKRLSDSNVFGDHRCAAAAPPLHSRPPVAPRPRPPSTGCACPPPNHAHPPPCTPPHPPASTPPSLTPAPRHARAFAFGSSACLAPLPSACLPPPPPSLGICRCGLIHGQLKGEEKARALEAFKRCATPQSLLGCSAYSTHAGGIQKVRHP